MLFCLTSKEERASAREKKFSEPMKPLTSSFTRLKSGIVLSELKVANENPKPRGVAVFLHGLLGTKRNWSSIGINFSFFLGLISTATAIPTAVGMDAIALDARGHGDSSHHPQMSIGKNFNSILRIFS